MKSLVYFTLIYLRVLCCDIFCVYFLLFFKLRSMEMYDMMTVIKVSTPCWLFPVALPNVLCFLADKFKAHISIFSRKIWDPLSVSRSLSWQRWELSCLERSKTSNWYSAANKSIEWFWQFTKDVKFCVGELQWSAHWEGTNNFLDDNLEFSSSHFFRNFL